MTITELKYIIALANEQHFGRAAQSVFVSQPTLSIGVKKLEAELGVQIFERLSNKVLLTPVGQHIVEAARNTLMSTDVIRGIADAAQGREVSEIKLGAIYTICPYILPKMIPDLQVNNANIKLFIEENYTTELINSLKDGELDVVLLSPPITDSNLFEVKTIFTESFHVIMPKNHPLEKYDSLTPEQLQSERVFLLGSGNCFREQVLQACPDWVAPEKSNDAPGKQLLQGGSLATIQMMVAGGLGVSVFPKMAIGEHPGISVRPFAEPMPRRQIALAWRKSFAHRQVITAIEDSLRRCQSE